MQTERMTPERRAEIERDLESVREENRTLREAYDGTQRILASGVGMLESLDRIAKLHKMGRGARAGGGTDA